MVTGRLGLDGGISTGRCSSVPCAQAGLVKAREQPWTDELLREAPEHGWGYVPRVAGCTTCAAPTETKKLVALRLVALYLRTCRTITSTLQRCTTHSPFLTWLLEGPHSRANARMSLYVVQLVDGIHEQVQARAKRRSHDGYNCFCTSPQKFVVGSKYQRPRLAAPRRRLAGGWQEAVLVPRSGAQGTGVCRDACRAARCVDTLQLYNVRVPYVAVRLCVHATLHRATVLAFFSA